MVNKDRMIDDLQTIIDILKFQSTKSTYDSQFNREPVVFKKTELDEIITSLKDHTDLMVIMYKKFDDVELMEVLFSLIDNVFLLLSKKKKLLWIYTFEFNTFTTSILQIETSIEQLKKKLEMIHKITSTYPL